MTTPNTAIAIIRYPKTLHTSQVTSYYMELAAWAFQERDRIEPLFQQHVSDGKCTDCVEDRIEFVSLSLLNSAEGRRFTAQMAEELN